MMINNFKKLLLLLFIIFVFSFIGVFTANAAIVVTVNASPGSVPYNSGSIISWTATEATSCSVYNGATLLAGPFAYPATSSWATPLLTSTTTFTVTCTGPDPDLTADSVPQTTATLNVATSFTSLIRNVGLASTGGNFYNFFQVATGAGGGGTITDISSTPSPMGALSAGGSATATSASYTFTSSGTYSVRACADKLNSGDLGLIDEGSNEGNNCSSWTNVVVNTSAQGSIIWNMNTTIGGVLDITGANVSGFPKTTNTGPWNGTLTGLSGPYTITGSWGSGSGNIIKMRICNVNGGQEFYDGNINVSTPSASWVTPNLPIVIAPYTVYLTAGNVEPTLCSGVSPANLTASAPPQNTATVGTALTFSSTISNVGGTSTGTSFNNFFQLSSSAGGAGPYSSISVNTAGPVSSGGSTAVTSSSYTFSSAGTYSVRACADSNSSFNGTISESNEGDNCSSWTNVTVGAAVQSNLTAGVTSPTTATVGTPLNFSGLVSNTGTGSTVSSFNNFFQLSTTANGGNPSFTAISANSMAALASGGSSTATSSSYTFSSAGTYSVRLCADNNMSMSGTITESNEGDNCSAWTNVTVGTAPTPDLVAGTTSPNSATAGLAVSFSSIVSNSGSATTGLPSNTLFRVATSSGGGGTVSNISSNATPILGSGSSSNITSSNYTFPSAGVYSVQACADNGNSIAESNESNNCSIWNDVTVSVAIPSPTATLTADPNPILLGESTTLTWSSTSTDYCTSNFFGGQGPSSGNQSVIPPSLPYTYTLTCVNTTISEQASASIDISVTIEKKPLIQEN